jgi:hypothetical protein
LCGIAGFHLKHKGKVKQHGQMEQFADLLLTGIEQRGRQATGFVAVTADGKRYEIDKRPQNAKDFIKERKRLPIGTRTFLGHTRYATQGSNENHANLHPVIAGTCLTTHNGGIWNDGDLFKKHEIHRNAEVDTEIIPALIHKHGWENAAQALHELHGSFAIASIDLKHPGEVLLAKGDFSPLYWIETENFVVWASTDKAVRDAWAEVLGTPPAWNKFSKLDEGDMLWIKGHVIEPAKFELPTTPFRRADNPARQAARSSTGTGSGSRSGGPQGVLRPIFERRHQHGTSGSGSKPSQRGGESGSTNTPARGVVPDRSDEVRQLRADGNGKAILHRQRSYAELKKITAGANPIFDPCSGCGAMVLSQCFVYRTGEGKICTDCNYIAEWSNKALHVDDATRAHLNKWANRESFVHGAALKTVSRATGLSAAAIDYLVFRAPEKYLNDHPAMAELAEKLDDLYQEAYSAAFDDILDEANANGEVDGPNLPNTGGNCYWDPQGKSATQGAFIATASCKGDCYNYACEKKKASLKGSEDEKPWAIDNVHPITEKYVAPKCDTCKKFKRKDAECSFCTRVKAKAEDERERTTLNPNTCWCGEVADRIIGGIVGFCQYHYVHCNHADCEFGVSQLNKKRGVVAPANHLLPSGQRVCHHHARGQKGAFSDKALSQKGVVVRDAAGATQVGGL